MSEQITTLRETFEDGSQLHESAGGTEVMELGEELVEQIGRVAESINGEVDGKTVSLGMGLWVNASDMLGRLPKPNSRDKALPHVKLFPILDAFGKFVSANSREILQGLKPTYVRVLAIGPEAGKVNSWHCDPLLESVKEYCISRTYPNVGRIVVGVDGRLRKK